MFNRNLFRAKAIEHGLRLSDIAVILGINPATLTKKLAGKTEFTRNEIQLYRNALGLTAEECDAVFFGEELA